MGLDRPSKYVDANVVVQYWLALPPCPCPRTGELRGFPTSAVGGGSRNRNPYPSFHGLVSPSKCRPTSAAVDHALTDATSRHLSWGFVPSDARGSGRPVSLEVPPPGSRRVRFLTAARLALRPEPFRFCFVSVAPLGFAPSERFPSEEPHASQRRYPPDVTPERPGRKRTDHHGRSPSGYCSPRKSVTLGVLVGHHAGRCSPGVVPLQGFLPRGRSAALHDYFPRGLGRNRSPKAATTTAPQGLPTAGLAGLSRGCLPSWGFPPCRPNQTSLQKDTS